MKGKQNKEKRYFCDWSFVRYILFVVISVILLGAIAMLLTVVYINTILVRQIEGSYPEQWYSLAEQDETYITLYRENKESFDTIMNVNGSIKFNNENEICTIECQNEQIVIECIMIDDEENTELDGVTRKYKTSDLSELSVERWRTKGQYISDCKHEAFNEAKIWAVIFVVLCIPYGIATMAASRISLKRKEKAQA